MAPAVHGKEYFPIRPAGCVSVSGHAAVQDRPNGRTIATLPIHAAVRIGEVQDSWVQVAFTLGQSVSACNATDSLGSTGWIPVKHLRGIHRLAKGFVPRMAGGKPLFDTPETADDSDENCGVATRVVDYKGRELIRLSPADGTCPKARSGAHCGNVEADQYEVFFVGHEEVGGFLMTRQPRGQAASATVVEFGPGLETPKTWLSGKCIESSTFPVELRGASELAVKGIALRGSEKDPIAKAPEYAVNLTWRFIPSRRPPLRAAIAFDHEIQGEALAEISLPDRATIRKGYPIWVVGGGRTPTDAERLAIRFGQSASSAWVGLDFFDTDKIRWKPSATPLLQTLLAREW